MNKKITLFIICLLFIISRLYLLLFFEPQKSDLEFLYAEYGYEMLLAEDNKMDFYTYHARYVYKRYSEGLTEQSPEFIERLTIVPYPPIAISWLSLPNLFLSPDLSKPMESWVIYKPQYIFLSRLFNAIFDSIMFAIFCFILLGKRSIDGTKLAAIKLLSFMILTFIMAHLLYDRLDLVFGALIAISLVLVFYRVHYLYVMLILAVSVQFKLVSGVLLPIMILATIYNIPRNELNQIDYLNLLKCGILRLFSFFVFLFAITGIYYLIDGEKTIDYLVFLQNRGIQVETLYSSLLFAFSQILGFDFKLIYDFGSDTVITPYSEFVTGLSTILIVIGLILVYVLYYFLIFKYKASKESLGADLEKGLAVIHFNFIIITLFVLLSLSKVFSTQFTIWIICILPFLTLSIAQTTTVSILYILICLLTTYIFPYSFDEMVGNYELVEGFFESSSYNSFYLWILFIRNVLFVGLGVMITYFTIAQAKINHSKVPSVGPL